jgi:CHAT domain-containing protein/tetratricopeptide (TPR) repeat protein
MRRKSIRILGLLYLMILVWPPTQAWAQQAPTPQAADFPTLYERWQQFSDVEQRIELGEQLLELEVSLADWPMQTTRGDVKAELWFGLGSSYVARTRGVRAENSEKGITYLSKVLAVWTSDGDPSNWARAHNNIGLAYWGRIKGEPADNQDKAIAHFETAMTVFSREAAPIEWAQLQNNLAIVHFSRARGRRAANLETAIGHFSDAQSVFTREAYPPVWAQIQVNLGIAYGRRVEGGRADNRERAITHLEAALSIFSREANPFEWASAQHSLGSGYASRDQGDRAANIEKAIEHFGQALTVFTAQDFPEQWAKSQSGLGSAYADRVGDKGDGNRGKAVAAFDAALTIFTRDTFPLLHMETAQRLGRALMASADWTRAGAVQASAREAFLLMFGEGLEDVDARRLVASAGPLFSEAAFSALQRGDLDAAFNLIDEGRARLMSVSLRLQSLELPAVDRRRLEALRGDIRTSQEAVDSARGSARAEAIDRLGRLRRELLALVASGQPHDGKAARSALARATEVSTPGNVIVVPVVTNFGGKLILARKSGTRLTLAAVDAPDLTSVNLGQLLIGAFDGPLAGWYGAYFINSLSGSEQANRWPEWLAAIDTLGPKLWALFGARLETGLKEQGIGVGTRLIWLPSGWLGVLPLAITQNPATRRRLGDDYEITYAPNIDALVASQQVIDKAGSPTLAAIVNPTGDLPGTEKEGALVASHFGSGARTVLRQKDATASAVLAGLKGRNYWHFASHGTFSWSDPEQSGLLMQGQERLSIGRLLSTDGLGRPRLVVLSACETGLSDVQSSPDEFIGLPGTFMALGAAGVVGTLWPVSDAATALLIAKFYELHLTDRLPPSTALRRAQSWLRQATTTELDRYARRASAQGRLEQRHLAELAEALSPERRDRSSNSVTTGSVEKNTPTANTKSPTRPYAHPYFWAGFIFTGL